MLVKCPVIVPLIELQVTKCVHQKEVHVTWSVIQLATPWKNMNVWEINDSGSISLLVHSCHQKSVSFILYKSNLHILLYSTETESKKPLWGGGRKGGGSGRLIAAINLTFKTCNL